MTDREAQIDTAVSMLSEAAWTGIPCPPVRDHRFIHPRIEPEIASRLSLDVEPDDPTVIESCMDVVAPALEITDSRYRDFRFTHVNRLADNTSAAVPFPRDVTTCDVAGLGVVAVRGV